MKKIINKRQIKRDLNQLAKGELYHLVLLVVYYFAIKLLFVMLFKHSLFKIQLVSFYPLLLLLLFLGEGSFYWHNTLRRLKRKRALSRQQVGKIYEPLLWLNWSLLLGYLPVLILSLPKVNPCSLFIGLSFYLLAFVELVNYFYIRLSYELDSSLFCIRLPLVDLMAGQGKKSKLRHDLELHFQQNYKGGRK